MYDYLERDEFMKSPRFVLSAFQDFIKSDIGIILCVVVGLAIAVLIFIYARVKTKKSRLMKNIHALNKHLLNSMLL